MKKQGERAGDRDGLADGGGRACSPARCQHGGTEAWGQLVGPLESAVRILGRRVQTLLPTHFVEPPEGEDGPN